MVAQPVQGFAIGDRVWFADGRNGIVNEAVFEPSLGFWLYGIEGIGRLFDEAFLLSNPPGEPALVRPEDILLDFPAEPTEAFLTPVDLERHLAVFHAGPDVTPAGLADLEEKLVAQVVAVQQGLTITISELNEGLEADLEGVRGDVVALEVSLKSLFVTQQSEIASRQEAIEEASGPGGFLGFVQSVAGFARSPIDSLLDTIGGYILREVEDGLNR